MRDVTMRRSMKTQLAVSLIVPALLLSSTVLAQDATPEATADRATVAELEAALGPVPTPSEQWKICAIEKTLINEHWQQMKKGYEDAAAELGVTVEVQASKDESDLTGQLAIAEAMMQSDCDAFAVSPLSSSNLQPFLDEAKAAGIPVINVDDAKVDATVFVGGDHREMGVMAAEYIAEQLPDGGQVAQIEGQAGSPAAQQRIDGYSTTVGEHANLQLVASQPGDWDRLKALDAAANIMRANPDVKAFYANNDTMALGVVEAVANAGKQGEVIVVGTDGVPDAIQSVRDGNMDATIASFPYEMGRTALEVAVRLLEGQDVPATVVSQQELITADNVDEYYPES
jgi:ABC-type sugar transport system substrate-binding protein